MKKIIICLMVISVITASFLGCSDESADELIAQDYVAMDTIFTISIGKTASSTGKSSDDIFASCEALTADIESVLSATDPASDVSVFNSGVDALFDADPIFAEVMATALEISKITDGTYDPSIGSLTTLWNVKGGGPVPSEDKIEYAKSKSGSKFLSIDGTTVSKSDPDVRLDLGGIGKGYAAQRLAEHLYESGVSYGIVSAGRTVGVFGEKPDKSPFKIGIADPFTENGILGYLYATSGFVSVAGDYELYFEENGVKYHHIIDPATGKPAASGLSSVAVFSQNGASADALSTALLVMGHERGMELYKSGDITFEAVFIGSDGAIMLTDGLKSDRFEINESYKAPAVTTAAPSSGETAKEN